MSGRLTQLVFWLAGMMTRIHLLLSLLPTIASEELADYPGCGWRNPRKVAGDECLWDCDWVDNPLYNLTWSIDLVDQNIRDSTTEDKKTIFYGVQYTMTTPKLPKDLRCLDDCKIPTKVVSPLSLYFIFLLYSSGTQ